MSTALLASFLLLTAVIINSGGLNTNGIITCNTCQNMKSINSDSRVLINGYNSAKNSIIQSPMIKCHGNQACINTEIKAGIILFFLFFFSSFFLIEYYYIYNQMSWIAMDIKHVNKANYI